MRGLRPPHSFAIIPMNKMFKEEILMLLIFLVVIIATGFLYFYLDKRFPTNSTVTKSQAEWVLRRDENKCCFIHLEGGKGIFICNSDSKYVYRVVPLRLIERILIGDIIIPHYLVSLCEHHYKLVLMRYNASYEKDLSEVSYAHTQAYQSSHPDDEFPY